MKNNSAPTGLMSLDISIPHSKTADWLRSLASSGIISREAHEKGLSHFGIQRDSAAWLLFLRRIFALAGMVFMISGLIFFMAWNWESMSRFAKFAALQGAFIALGAYSVLRWAKNSEETRWDARIALLGAAFTAGGMFALYGQVYQTGADAWELFRAWTIVIIILAVPGRATAFWFMAWIVGSLWGGLYLYTHSTMQNNVALFVLIIGLGQFALLAVHEAARLVLARRGIAHDSGRWLARSIGCVAIIMASFYAIDAVAVKNAWGVEEYKTAALYIGGMLALLAAYCRLLPELSLVFLCVSSLATFFCAKGIRIVIVNIYNRTIRELCMGLLIIFTVFAALKIFLVLRNLIKRRFLQTEQTEKENMGGDAFSSREMQKTVLTDWLLKENAAPEDKINTFYATEEAEYARQSPWYVRLFVTLGVWAGSITLMTAATFLIFGDPPNRAIVSIAGFVLCGLTIQFGYGRNLAAQAFSQVMGVCGLIYILFFLDAGRTYEPTFAIIALIFGLFWLLKPPFAARTGAFIGMLVFLLLLFTEMSGPAISFYKNAAHHNTFAWKIKNVMYCLGLVWAAYYIAGPGGRYPAPVREKLAAGRARLKAIFSGAFAKNSFEEKPKRLAGKWFAKRFDKGEVFSSSAYASLIVFAGVIILLPDLALYFASLQSGVAQGLYYVLQKLELNFSLSTMAAFAVISGIIGLRCSPARIPALLVGGLLALCGWFAPAVAVGLGLLLLSFRTGKNSFLAAAILHLSLGTFLYYYNMEISLLHKSLILMATGLSMVALSLVGGLLKTGDQA